MVCWSETEARRLAEGFFLIPHPIDSCGLCPYPPTKAPIYAISVQRPITIASTPAAIPPPGVTSTAAAGDANDRDESLLHVTRNEDEIALGVRTN